MERKKLTKQVVEGLKAPAKGSEYHYDTEVPSLAVCVTANGVKTFYRVGRIHGKPQRIKLGRFGDITVFDARKEAAAVSMVANAGRNPKLERITGRMTLRELWEWYLVNHAKARKKSWQRDVDRWVQHIEKWGASKALGEITKADVVAFHATLGEKIGTYGANHVLAQLKHMLNVAVEHEWLQGNPAAIVKRFPRRSRKRFLGPDEIPRFLAAVDSLRSQTARDFFRMLLFTGARRSNVAAMQWRDINMEAGVWTVVANESKNKEPMPIVLAEQALEILKRRRGESKWVFPSAKSETGHFAWPKTSWKQMLAKSGLTNLRIHDLRRTMGSWMLKIGTPLAIIGESLGHRSLSATHVYTRFQFDQVRESVSSAVNAMLKTIPKE